MGLRFRKSKKIGPLRINLSGSGVGWSIGGKHFRYTQPAKGKAYTTTTIPGTGISSRNTVQSAPRPLPHTPPQSVPLTPARGDDGSVGTAVSVAVGLVIGALIILGVKFAVSLSGYTPENMIPPPPDRSAQLAAAETEYAAPADPPETIVTLSAPETTPETDSPEKAAPETEAAEILALDPDPAETTLEEWFALVEARVKPRGYVSEPPEEDETSFDEWAEAHKNDQVTRYYTVNTSTEVIHEKDSCPAAKQINPENLDFTTDPESLLAEGYTWCGRCHKN